MKSVVQAAWLLTIAFGNIIVLIVAQFSGLAQVCTKRSRSTCLPKDFPPSSSAALPLPLCLPIPHSALCLKHRLCQEIDM